MFDSVYSTDTLLFPSIMAPKNSYHATEIRALRTEIDEKDAEIAELKAALEKANENACPNKEKVNIEAITKKIRDEVWLENRNKSVASEKEFREEIAAYKKENADLKKENLALKTKIQFQEKRMEQWKHIGDKTAGPAKVHEELRQEKAKHAKTLEKVRQLEAKMRQHAQTSVNQDKIDLLCDNLHIAVMEKEETIQSLTTQVKDLQQLCDKLHKAIQTLNSVTVRRESVLYRYMYAKTKTTLDTYHLPDIATVLREMAINGNIAMILRVDKDTYDLVIKSGITSGIPQWMFFNNVAKVLGINADNVLFTMPIKDNHYSVVMTN